MKVFAGLVLSALFIGVSASAQIAEQLLTRDVLTSQKVLTTDVKLYSYFGRDAHPSLNSLEGRREFTQRILANSGGMFWNMDFQDASPSNFACGPGLYLAIDPHISKKYGNSFLELRVPKGTRFINVVHPIPLKKDTLDALMSEGLITASDVAVLFPKQKGFYRDTLRAMVLPQYTAFRNMVQRMFEVNGIQFVEYNFNTSLMNFCKKHSYSAFLYVGSRNPNNPKAALVTPEFSEVNMFSTQVEFLNQSTEEVNILAEITKFRALLDEMSKLREAKIGIPKTLVSTYYTPEEVQEIKMSTYSCQ